MDGMTFGMSNEVFFIVVLLACIIAVVIIIGLVSGGGALGGFALIWSKVSGMFGSKTAVTIDITQAKIDGANALIDIRKTLLANKAVTVDQNKMIDDLMTKYNASTTMDELTKNKDAVNVAINDIAKALPVQTSSFRNPKRYF